MLEKNIRKIGVFSLLGITLSVLSGCGTPGSQNLGKSNQLSKVMAFSQPVAKAKVVKAKLVKKKLAQKKAVVKVQTRTRAS